MEPTVVAGRFRLLGPLARGNMGEVHRAEDMSAAAGSADRTVAVKLILRGRSGTLDGTPPDSVAAKRFAREVRIMRKLDHPNLPRTIDGGIDDSGRPYLAMELLSGRPLTDLIDQHPQLPVSWVAALGAQIAAGVAAAHAEDVIHRDLKPANVMLLPGGRVKVLDFGLGLVVDDADADKLTSSGATVGTARYMAPEQFRHSAVTPAADLYALGCVLFELLTGVPPFHSESAYELGQRHCNDEPPPLEPPRTGLPRDLVLLVERLLKKDPADRPASAVAVRDALLRLAVGSDAIAGWDDANPVIGLHASAPTPVPGSAPVPRSAGTGLDMFEVHRTLIDEYRSFTEAGTVIRDGAIAAFVEKDLDSKSQWPDPWLSLNPFFAQAGTVLELKNQAVLHPECALIFQGGKGADDTTCTGRPLTLHQHQREAIDAAKTGESYVLTTGTGSGKSLSYIVPIVDRVLREREAEGPQAPKRVRAIIVYPMNALANSQLGELDKYLRHGYGAGREPVTYARYTGQEDDQRRKEIRENPPDILLTNYVMLELMLTRPDDREKLVRMATGLEFLVLDELHTYRGRQGADVALLVRRVREACRAQGLQCIGTSATMSNEGGLADRREVVADVASTLFGTPVRPENVIGETLERATGDAPASVPASRLNDPAAPRSYDALRADPLARWIEGRFGLRTEEGRLVRAAPARIEVEAKELAAASGVAVTKCVEAIQDVLRAGSEARHPVTGRPLFAFRLHQFLSKGDTVFVTLEEPAQRHLTRNYQQVQPGSDGKLLLPLAFCRDCGQEYLTVWRRETDNGQVRYEARRDTTYATGGKVEDGYLHVDPARPWPATVDAAVTDRRLPDSWLETDDHGYESVRESYRKRMPRSVLVDPHGAEGRGELRATYIPAPFLFCLHCGVSYEQVRGKDFAKLATLDQEGRSSATSVVSASIVRTLSQVPEAALDKKARKLLTFVDNRQDASLQAGHFNDFVQVTQLRGALLRALVDAGDSGLTHEDIANRVSAALGLELADYTDEPDPSPSIAASAARTLRDVVAFRLYRDLERGWRVTMPNLEQTGLLEIHYADLEWLAERQDRWSATWPLLRDATAAQRAEIMRVLLDEMRRALAIDVQYFRDDFDTLLRASEERLKDPWVLAATDRPAVGTVFPQPSRPGGDRADVYFSGRSRMGKYLKRVHFPDASIEDAQHMIEDLLAVLKAAGLVEEIIIAPQQARRRRAAGPARTGYRVKASALAWKAGTGEQGAHDPLRRTYASGDGPRVNRFFRHLYQEAAGGLAGLVAREHTAQVDHVLRQAREDDFRAGRLKLLYCSPTMELGVDISELNAVMMRNVPPTPANYAQRSGRAGRSGQPALVTTYCATGNSHDQYYFRKSDRMVAGVVAPPRLDLANEDLVRSHVQAVWLAECGLKLGTAVPAVIDTSYDEEARPPAPQLALHDHVRTKIEGAAARRRAVAATRDLLGSLQQTFAVDSTWWHDGWVEDVVAAAPTQFDRAFDRWRQLFRAALVDQDEQNRRVLDHSLSERDRQIAQRRRREAETQLKLLVNDSVDSKSVLSDFNPYRYLASEGFLPGYSFPRLPLAAYIPTSGRRFGDGDYLQRPRFLAIREFGPGALIYHEGARYQVDRIQLPPGGGGDLATTTAKRCEECGYLGAPTEDTCGMCQVRLPTETTGLLPLHTVYTTKRERISSDEEERRRAGFRLVTSYRFHDHGARPGRRDGLVDDAAGRIATLTYGDSATVRVTNVGRVRAKQDEPPGFWLDIADGRWMNERDAADAAGDSSELPVLGGPGDERRRKKRVIPYVEDRRNILVLRLEHALDEAVALSLMFALERAIEAKYELEDSELASELLPPSDGPRDRMLFTEAAEGGAGVLRQLQSERFDLSGVAKVALDICHFDLVGKDRGGSRPDRPCARGCYDCLLTYGNQIHHTKIDRHAVRDLLVRLAGSQTLATGRGETRSEQFARLADQSDTGLETRFLGWLKERGLRLPDNAQELVAAASARPDFVYRLPGANVAVFVDGPVHQFAAVAERDVEAEERLLNAGWEVVRFPHDVDWSAIAEKNATFFGASAGI